SQFIEIFYGMETTPVKDYIDDSFPGEWGTEDKDGNGVKVIRTTNFTNSGKLNLADVVTRSIEDRKVVRKQIKKYDTILERSGGTADNPVGRVVLFEEDNLFLCNNFTQVLRFKDVDPRFAFYALYYFYQTNRTAIRSMGSKTTGIQNLNMSKYLEIGIPNASDEDQKAFVTIAEQADKSEFVGCKSQFIEIFYGMETTPVKDYIDDSFPGEWGTEDKDGNGVKVIRTTNFTNSGKLNLADVVTRSIEDRKVVRKQIKKYDTILERSGGTADNPVGRVVLFEEDNLFLCNNFTQVLRFKDVDPRFAFYALYYFYQTNRTAIRSMGSKTTGIQNLNMSKYLEIGIPNASDEDQKAFVTIAEQADKSEYYN
ncbi:restriction endonuclease subunit S, partial [Phocaeicola vulgatus]|uniref:restriction endonuclease subunit S n=2 Tax=Bacteroidales TaxID=171549 RepID=UPI001E428802